jgi:small conductance mechanosensitive channel
MTGSRLPGVVFETRDPEPERRRQMIRSRFPILKSIFVLVLLLPTLALAVDESQSASTEQQLDAALETKDPGTSGAVDEDVEKIRTRIQEIRDEIASAREDIRKLDADARSTQGDDAWALRSNATEIRLGSASKLRELVDAVNELTEMGVDVSADRRRLQNDAPAAAIDTRSLFDSVDAELSQISVDREAANAEDELELAWRAEQLETVLERSLAIAVDQVLMLEELKLPSDEPRAWIANEVQQRARLAAARIHMWSARRADADALSAAAPDDASLVAAAGAAASIFQASTSTLEATVSMMNDLELDSSEYQQLIVESTGQISAEVFDRGVASQLVSDWTESGTESLVENGPGIVLKLLMLALIVTVFWALSRFVRRITERALRPARVRFSLLLKRMLVSLASGSVLVVGFLIALSQLGFEIGPMLTGLGIAGFVLGFALQDTLANFASGIMILAYRPFDVEDLIECAGGVFGKVSQMSLVSTTILTIDNQTLIVPNGKIWGDVITNVTAQRVRRVDLVFGIGYADDIPKTEQVLTSILEAHPKVLDDPEFVVKVFELGDSSVNFIVRPWVATDDYWDVYWDVTREVKMAFDREGISIPFPQRDVHFYNERGLETEATLPATQKSVGAEPARSETGLSAHDAALDTPAEEEDG